MTQPSQPTSSDPTGAAVDPLVALQDEVAGLMVPRTNERLRSSVAAVGAAYDGEPVEWVVEQLRNAITEAVGVTPHDATLQLVAEHVIATSSHNS
jgi:hypothetical protein